MGHPEELGVSPTLASNQSIHAVILELSELLFHVKPSGEINHLVTSNLIALQQRAS